MSDALKKLVDRHPGQVVEAWRANVPSKVEADTAREVVISPPAASAETPRIYPDERRRASYEQVHVRLQQGESQRSIARQLGIHRETVQRYAQAGSFPERAVRTVRTPLDSFRELLWQRWRGGLRNARRLHHELVIAGFKGSYYMVLRCVRGWRRLSVDHGTTPDKQQPLMRRPSARTVAWWLTRAREALSVEESSFLVKLEELCPDVAAARHLAHRFTDLLRNRRSEQLNAWLAEATAATSPLDLRRFASGLQSDLAAVRAAFELPWSNGQTEGHIHRLKALKRQMYGRAAFDLLRIRVLCVA